MRLTIILKVIFGMLFGFCIVYMLPICYTTSNSVGYKVFYLSGDKNIKVDDFVVFRHKLSPKMIKQVAGLSGSKINIQDNQVYVHSEEKVVAVGLIKSKDSKGKKVHATKFPIIPDRYFFARGTHEQSMDSRYQEFGLVSIDSIISRAIPLF